MWLLVSENDRRFEVEKGLTAVKVLRTLALCFVLNISYSFCEIVSILHFVFLINLLKFSKATYQLIHISGRVIDEFRTIVDF